MTSMLKLTYSLIVDPFKTVTVLGDPLGIRDLFWHLSGILAILAVKVTNLDGEEISEADLMARPYSFESKLSSNMNSE